MKKTVNIKLIGQSLLEWLTVLVEIKTPYQPTIEFRGTLPANPALLNALHQWHEDHRHLDPRWRSQQVLPETESSQVTGWRIKLNEVTWGASVEERRKKSKDSTEELKQQFGQWLRSEEFRPVSDRLRDELKREEPVQFLLRVEPEATALQELPWEEWDFLQQRPHATYALAPIVTNNRYIRISDPCLNILVILGDTKGIEVDKDAEFFRNLPGANVVFLPQRTQREIFEQLTAQPWDIIFFAGHSLTENNEGRLYINDRDYLTVDDLWYALKQAVERGLQLAIFNSCDGLGLSRRLNDLEIPQIIVMRELIPDRVAHAFLKSLLRGIQENLPIDEAIRRAKENLQAFAGDFPSAMWLPVLWQNGTIELPPESPPPPPPKTLDWRQVVATSLAVTCLVMGIRWLGWLQGAELAAFDRFMQPSANSSHLEPPDQRILLIEITESDVQKYGFPVPDGVLAQLLDRLQRYQPQVIGLNLWRDIPQQPGNKALVQQFQQNDRLIAVCQFPNVPQDQAEIPPPPASTHDRVGFNNLIANELSSGRDDTIRRYLLSRTPNGDEGSSLCNAEYSFAFHLAFQYLQAKGVEVDVQDNKLRFGDRMLLPLQSRSGGYQTIDARGYQLLINYRRAANIARSLTLVDALTSPLDPTLVRGKIVIIGVTAESGKDYWRTPFPKKMSGLHLHAHAVSQILSAVEDQRPLMGWLPPWMDALLIWVCALLGSSLVWLWRTSPLRLGVTVTLFTMTVYTLCRVGFFQGLWLPFIPLVLALAGSTLGLAAYMMLQIRSSNRPLPRYPQ